jgi:histidine triad (HIT) family protein
MSETCIFCKIVRGVIPSTKVYEDDQVYAFRDINPGAPVHVLIIPRAHLTSLAEIDESNAALAGHMLAVAAKIARSEGLAERGYRLVSNVGAEGGQSVFHLHFHVLGGRSLVWPPG